jgi:dihydroneopterin aldolase
MRTIGLEGMRFFAFVGFHEEEKILSNEIEVNVYISLESKDRTEDRVEQTLDYAIVYQKIKEILQEHSNLLETVCNKIQQVIRGLNANIMWVRVRVAKIHPPVVGRVEQIFVEEEWVRT